MSRIYKLISLVVAITFLGQEVSWTAPSFSLQSAPTSRGNPQSLYIPEQYGRIDKSVNCTLSTVNSQERPLVVLVKDAHCHYEAQRNIAKILDILIKDYKIDLVCVEGAGDKVDPSVIAGSPNDKRRKEVADEYLKKGYLTSSEVLAMERGKDYGFSIWGVEDLKLYLEDLKAFREVYSGSTSAGRFIELSKNLISNLKNRLYPADALAFDKKIQDYKDNKITLTGLIEYLYAIDKGGFTKYLNLRLVLKALILEKATDFNKVENERALIIKSIENRHPKEDIQALVKNSLLYKLGKVSSIDYYSYLKRFILPSEYKNYPNLIRYIQIIKIHSKIEEENLFKELDTLIESVYKIYIKDEISVKLHTMDGYINLLDKLSRLEITRDELIRYRQSVLKISDLIEFLKIQGVLNNINVPYELTDSAFINQLEGFHKQPEEFYRYALERDNALVSNLIKRMGEEGKDKAIIIIGGFHAEGVGKLLKEKNAQVITITPSITKEDTEAKRIYLSRMMDERIQPDEMIRRLGLNNLGTQPITGIEWQDKFLRELDTIENKAIGTRLRGVMKRGFGPEDLKAALGAAIQTIESEEQIDEADRVKIGVLKRMLNEGDVEITPVEAEKTPSAPGGLRGARKNIVDTDYVQVGEGDLRSVIESAKEVGRIEERPYGHIVYYSSSVLEQTNKLKKTGGGYNCVLDGKTYVFVDLDAKDKEIAEEHEVFEIYWENWIRQNKPDLHGMDITRAAHILAWGQQIIKRGWTKADESDFIMQQLRNSSITQLIRIKNADRWIHNRLRGEYLPIVGITEEQLKSIDNFENSVKEKSEEMLGSCSGIVSTENYGNDEGTRNALETKIKGIRDSEKTIILSYKSQKVKIDDWNYRIEKVYQIKIKGEIWALDIGSGKWVEEKTREQKTNEEMQGCLGIDLRLFLAICEGKGGLSLYLAHPEDCRHHLLIDKAEDKNEYALAFQDKEGNIYINKDIYDLNDSSLIFDIAEFLNKALEIEKREEELFKLIMRVINGLKDRDIPDKDAIVKSLLSKTFHDNFPGTGLLTKAKTAEIAASLYVKALNTKNVKQRYILHCAAESMFPEGSQEKIIIRRIMQGLTVAIPQKPLITLEEAGFTGGQLVQQGEADIDRFREKLEAIKSCLGTRVNVFLLDPQEVTPYAFAVYWNNEKRTIDIYINKDLLNKLRANLVADLVDPYNFDLPDEGREARMRQLRLKVKAYLYTLEAKRFFEKNGTPAEGLDTQNIEELEVMLMQNGELISGESDAKRKWLLEQYYQALKAYRIAYMLLDSGFYELALDYFIIAKTLLPQTEGNKGFKGSIEEIIGDIKQILKIQKCNSITFGFNPVEEDMFRRVDELVRKKRRVKGEDEIDPGMEGATLIADGLTLEKNGKIKSQKKASFSKPTKGLINCIESVLAFFYKNRKLLKEGFGVEYSDLEELFKYFDLMTFKGRNGLAKIEIERGRIFINEELFPRDGDDKKTKRLKEDAMVFLFFCLLYRHKYPETASANFISDAEKRFLSSFPSSWGIVKFLNNISGDGRFEPPRGIDKDLGNTHRLNIGSEIRWFMHRWRKLIIATIFAAITAAGLFFVCSSKAVEEPARQQEIIEPYLDPGDFLKEYDDNIYAQGEEITEDIAGQSVSIDRDLLDVFCKASGLEGDPNINDLINKLLENAQYDKNNTEKKAELARLLQDYVDIIQGAEPEGKLPVILIVGGSKNYDVGTGTGTDLIESIGRANGIGEALEKKGINVKVAPFYRIDSKRLPTNKGIEGHINYITRMGLDVLTARNWMGTTRRFVQRHMDDVPSDNILLASVINLLIKADKGDGFHLIYVGHGHKYSMEEGNGYHRLWTPVIGDESSTPLKTGGLVRVGKDGYFKIYLRIPSSIETLDFGCSSSESGVTFVGAAEDVEKFIKELSTSDNIGKDITFNIINDNTIEINGQKIDGVRDVTIEGRLKKIKLMAESLNIADAHPEFIDQLEQLLRGGIKVYTGTDETRKAGAFGHMEGNGVIYIDELFLEDDMAIIHEAIHAYLEKMPLEELMERIDRSGIGEKIKRKAADASKNSPVKYPAYLRHYYARYYLQNPKGGSYDGSENKRLTEAIRNIILSKEIINTFGLRERDIEESGIKEKVRQIAALGGNNIERFRLLLDAIKMANKDLQRMSQERKIGLIITACDIVEGTEESDLEVIRQFEASVRELAKERHLEREGLFRGVPIPVGEREVAPFSDKEEAEKKLAEIKGIREEGKPVNNTVLQDLYRLACTFTGVKGLDKDIRNELYKWVMSCTDERVIASIIVGWALVKDGQGRTWGQLRDRLKERYGGGKGGAIRMLYDMAKKSAYQGFTLGSIPRRGPPQSYEEQLKNRNIYGQIEGEWVNRNNILNRVRTINVKEIKAWLTGHLHEKTGGEGKVVSIIPYGSYLYGFRTTPSDLDVLVIVDEVSTDKLPKKIKGEVSIDDTARRLLFNQAEYVRSTTSADVTFITVEQLLGTAQTVTKVINAGIVLQGEGLVDFYVGPSPKINCLAWAEQLATEGRRLATEITEEIDTSVWRAKSMRRLLEANLLIYRIDPSVAVPQEKVDFVIGDVVKYLDGGVKLDRINEELIELHGLISRALIHARISLVWQNLEELRAKREHVGGPRGPIKITPLTPEELTRGTARETGEGLQGPQEPAIETEDMGKAVMGEEEIHIISKVIVEKVRERFESIKEYSGYQGALGNYWSQFVFMLEDFIKKQGVGLDDNSFYKLLIRKIAERIETMLGLKDGEIIISFTEEEFGAIKKEIVYEIERQKAERAAEKERQEEERRKKEECWKGNKEEIKEQVTSFIKYLEDKEGRLVDEIYEKFRVIPAMRSDNPETIKGWIYENLGSIREQISKDLEVFIGGGDWSNAGVFHSLIELYYYNDRTIPIPGAISKCIERVAIGIELEKGLEVGTIVGPSSDNIGKGVIFRRSGDKLIIRLPDGNEVEVEIRGLTTGIDSLKENLKEKVRQLNASELGGDFIKMFDNLRVMVFTGTPETQAAGAFASVDENGVVSLDEVLLKTSAGDMVIIHEVIHAFLKGMSGKDLKDRIDKCPMVGKIRKKARGVPALLRHYYARYYLQNPIGGSYDGSENRRLTEAIRNIILSKEIINIFGLKEEDIKGSEIREKVKQIAALGGNVIERFRHILELIKMVNEGSPRKIELKKIIGEIVDIALGRKRLVESSIWPDLLGLLTDVGTPEETKKRISYIINRLSPPVPREEKPKRDLVTLEEWREGIKKKLGRELTLEDILGALEEEEIGFFKNEYVEYSRKKLEEVARKLDLKPGQRYLHVGASCSWVVILLTLYGVKCTYLDVGDITLRCLIYIFRDAFDKLGISYKPDESPIDFRFLNIDGGLPDIKEEWPDTIKELLLKLRKEFQDNDKNSFDAISMFDVFFQFEDKGNLGQCISNLLMLIKDGGTIWFTPRTTTLDRWRSVSQTSHGLSDLVLRFRNAADKYFGGSIEGPSEGDITDEYCEKYGIEDRGNYPEPDNKDKNPFRGYNFGYKVIKRSRVTAVEKEGDGAIEELARLLGLKKAEVEDILNQDETPPELLNTLRELLTKDIRDEDELRSRLQIVFESAEKVVRILNMVKGDLPEGIRANLSNIQESLAIYLAVNEMRRREGHSMPCFIEGLKDKLGAKGLDEVFVDNVIAEIERLEGFYIDESGNVMPSPYFEIMLSTLLTMVPDAKIELETLYKYKRAKAEARIEYKVGKCSAQGVKPDEVVEIVKAYLRGKVADGEVFVEVIARYKAEKEEFLKMFDDQQRKMVEKGLNNILGRSMKDGLKGEMGVAIEPLSGGERGVLSLAIRGLEKLRSRLESELPPTEAQIDESIPDVIDASLLVGDTGEDAYGEAIVSDLREMAEKGTLHILYSNDNQKEEVESWLRLNSIQRVTFIQKDNAIQKLADGAVWMLSPEMAEGISKQIPEDKMPMHRIVKGKGNPVDNDLILMTRIRRILRMGTEEVETNLRKLYERYYLLGGFSGEEVKEMIDKAVEQVQKGGLIIVELPPILPVMKVYMLMLQNARKTLAVSV